MTFRRRLRHVSVSLLSLVACGVAGGVMVAAAVFPAVGLSGLSAKAASDSFQNLPSALSAPDVPESSYLYTADGKFIASFHEEHRVPVTLPQVPMVVRLATVAAEDSRFYDHNGVDPQGIVRAFVANQQAGEVTQGASTLTQQYVRNVLKYSAKTKEQYEQAVETTAARKLREIRYAMAVEQQMSKDEILLGYLNISYYGDNAYGINAAASVYFSKRPDELTLPEAALLAGIVQSPSVYDPVNNGLAKASERRDYVLQRMADLKFITQADADAAKNQPIKLNPNKPTGSCANGDPAYGFYCDYFVEWWKSQPSFGKSTSERYKELRTGGYRIYTALDSRIQAAAQKAIDSQVSRNSRFAAGTVFVEPGTGYVKAMAISRTYSLAPNPGGRDYPNTVNPLLTGSQVSPGYQAGSTFKMFTMVAALRRGMPLNTSIYSPPKVTTPYVVAPGPASCGNYYCPGNASPGMTGTHTMWSGFGESVNTYFVQLEMRATVTSTVKTAEDLGIVFRGEQDRQLAQAMKDNPPGDWGAFTLGVSYVPPLDMANAYATVAARGKKCEPTPLRSAKTSNGTPLKVPGTSCKQVIPKEVADAAADAARCPVGQKALSTCVRKNGATAWSVGEAITRPLAGKTGTTDSNQAAWFVGFTPNLASAVFYADPDAPQTSSVPQTEVPRFVFTQAMKEAVNYVPWANFVKPTSKMAWGNKPPPSTTTPRRSR